jgi:hypothetical protein
MTLSIGDSVWIPCDVTHGVFPDERNVSIAWEAGRWVGYVDVRHLRDEIMDGRTAIRATVMKASHDEISARLPGQMTHHQYLRLRGTERSGVQEI